jgi:hypothetical protein
MQRFTRQIDGNSAFSLAGATNGGNFSTRLGQFLYKFPGSPDQCVPPIVRRLFGADLIHDVKRNRSKGPPLDDAVQSHQGAFAAGCSQVDGEHKPVVTRSLHGFLCLFRTA